MLSILTNTTSLVAQNSLNNTNMQLSTSLNRLSTGLKINTGADGPAALVISQAQQAQITGLSTAISNTNEAVSVVQTGEGALNEISNLLGTIRGLVLDAANSGVNDANALAADQSEISNAVGTITSIANQTQFGSKKLLDGSAALGAASNNVNVTGKATGSIAAGSYTVNVTQGATRANVQGADVTGQDLTNGGLTNNETLTINGQNVSFSLSSTAATSLSNAATAINNASANTGVQAVVDSTGGTDQLRLYSTNFGTGNKITVSSSNTAATSVLGAVVSNSDGQNIQGTFTDATGNQTAATGVGNVLTAGSGTANGLSVTYNPQNTTTYTSATNNPIDADTNSATITVDTSKALTFQIGANAGQTASIALNDSRSTALGQGVSSFVTNLSQIDVTKLGSNTNLSKDFLNVVDKAISDVSSQRGQLGAFQSNTLQSNAANLQTTLQNTTSAQSTIRDTDFASEIAKYTKLQTQEQAGASVLSNANSMTSLVAQLIQKM